MPADDLRLDRRSYRWDRRNEWLGRLRCGLGWGFLMHVGDLKPISFGERNLIDARSDGRFVHSTMSACRSYRCRESLADGQGAEQSQTRSRKPHCPDHTLTPREPVRQRLPIDSGG